MTATGKPTGPTTPSGRRRPEPSRRGAVESFADACIRAAARRWPSEIRDGMAAEWRAELAILRGDPRLGRAARSWRQLAFAVSLACSPSVDSESENPMTLTRRDRRPALGFAVRRLTLYAGISFAAALLPGATRYLWFEISTQNRSITVPRGEDIAGTLGAKVLALVAMALLGVAAARWAPRPAGRPLAVAAFVTVPLGVACYILYYGAVGNQVQEVMPTRPPPAAALGFAVWTVLATVTLAVALRLAAAPPLSRARRRVAATVTAAAGLLVAFDAAGWVTALPAAGGEHVSPATGPLWSPLTLLPFDAVASGTGQEHYEALTVVTGVAGFVAAPALMCAAFAAAYLLRGAAVAVPAGETSRPERGQPRPALASPALRGCAYAVAAAGLVAWACVLALVGPPDRVNYPMDDHGIVPSTAFVAILLAVLAFVVANAGRGPVAGPAVGVFAVLAGTDRLISAAQPMYAPVVPVPPYPHGPALAAGLFALGATALAAAAWLTGRLASDGTTIGSARRALAGVVVVATFSVPAAVTFADLWAHRAAAIPPEGGPISGLPPMWLTVLALAVAGLLIVTAFVAALAARPDPLPRPATAALAVLTVGVALLPLTIGDTLRTALYWPMPQFFTQPMLAVVVLAVLRWRRPTRPVLAAAGWVLAGLAAAALTVPLYASVRDLAQLVAGLLVPAGSITFPPPYVFGPMAFGVALAAVAGRWLVPPERGVPATPAGPPDPVIAGPKPVTA